MTRIVLLALAPLALSACAVDRFGVHDATCDAKFWKYSDDLTAHLMKGNRRAGTWSYDPAGRVASRNVGSYDFASGDFDWAVRYDPSHYRTLTEVDGYGFARPNGDLDVAYSVTTTYVDDSESTYEVREQRVGCELLRRVSTSDGVEVTRGTYGAASLTYTRSSGGYDVDGVLFADGHYTESLDASDYSFELVGDADGYSREEWAQQSGSSSYDGVTERFLDGSAHYTYDATGSDGTLTWDYEVDFYGDGEGTVTGSGLSCDLTFVDGSCTYDCGGGQTGAC